MSTRKHHTKKQKVDMNPSEGETTDGVFKCIPKTFCLELFQFHLRKCVKSVIDKKGLPPALEDTVKQLWVLFVNKMDMTTVKQAQDQDDEDVENEECFPKMTYLTQQGSNIRIVPIDPLGLPKFLHSSFLLVIIHLGSLVHRLPIFMTDIVK